MGEAIDITMICPITVETEFRSGSLIKPKAAATEAHAGSKVTVDDAVDQIIKAADRRDDKLIWPTLPSYAQKLKNFLPRTTANLVNARAKL